MVRDDAMLMRAGLRSAKARSIVALALLLVLPSFLAAPPNDSHTLHGVNFFTSNAINDTDMWRHFDAPRARRELGWMKDLGFNSIRLWLSETAWREDKLAFRNNLNDALNLADENQMSVMLVLFDCGGIESRKNPVLKSVGQAYRDFLQDPRLSDKQKTEMRQQYAVFAEGRGKLMPIPVAEDTPPAIIFWQNWTPNPGLRRLDEKDWPELDAYTDEVMTLIASRKGKTKIVVDLMNEPSTLMDIPKDMTYAAAKSEVVRFVRHTAERITEEYPLVPRTVGSSSIEDMKLFASLQTILSVHSYVLGKNLMQVLRQATGFASQERKPVLLTECLANTDDWLKNYGDEKLSTDEGQLRHYRETLPIVLQSKIGFYVWGGIAGRMFTPSTDLIYPSGYMRPAGLYLQQQLRNFELH